MEASANPKRILMIDDEVVLANLYVKLLTDEGYEAKLATTPEEAVESMESAPPALILLDCKMPLLSGEEFVEILSEKCPHQLDRAYVVGFSSFDPDMNVVETFKKRVDRFVRKPDDVDRFIELIDELVAESGQARAASAGAL